MAKIDNAEIPSFYMNPQAYNPAKGEAKKKGSEIRRTNTGFQRLFEEFRAKTADELGPVSDMPVSEETVNMLMDQVRGAGDVLRDRPFPDEIIRYKQAVRNFMYYVVENCYTVEHEKGIPKFLKPGYKGQRGTQESQVQARYTKIQVIDKKLEDLAAQLLADQKDKLKLAARLEEINGLLIDLLE
jgi:uncharacterized protein YaaR (DUF327 family)